MRISGRLLMAFLSGLLMAQAPKAPAPKYVPKPTTWKLELKGGPGGWTIQERVEMELKVVDPTDPDPPKITSWRMDDPDVEEAPSHPQNAWPDRPAAKVIGWFNGIRQEWDATVGYPLTLSFESRMGENRLELRLSESGQRLSRTWFGVSGRDRLVIQLSELEEGERSWWGGGLQVVEPDHTESIAGEPTPSGGRNRGDSYLHTSPLPGTWTVRWFDTSQGVDGYEWGSRGDGGHRKPKRVRVDVVLDPGTEQERRWRFERLVIPGTRRVTLGSFDVEN